MKTLLPILAALLLTACASASASTATPAPTETPASTAATLTLEQKVGQLFIVRPDALDLTLSQETIDDPRADGVTQVTDAMRETLQQYPVGGICQFGKNIESPSQLAHFNKDLQAASATPLFITVDEEGGMVAWRTTTPLTCPAMPVPPQWVHRAILRTPALWGRPSAGT